MQPVTMEACNVSGITRVVRMRCLEQRFMWERWPGLETVQGSCQFNS